MPSAVCVVGIDGEGYWNSRMPHSAGVSSASLGTSAVMAVALLDQ